MDIRTSVLQHSVCTFLVRITEPRVRASGVWVNKLFANDVWCELNRRKKMWQPVGRSVDGVQGVGVTMAKQQRLVTPGAVTISSRPDQAYTNEINALP